MNTCFAKLPLHVLAISRGLGPRCGFYVRQRSTSDTWAVVAHAPPLLLSTHAGGELTVHGIPVFIKEKANTGEGTGHTVWDGVSHPAA